MPHHLEAAASQMTLDPPKPQPWHLLENVWYSPSSRSAVCASLQEPEYTGPGVWEWKEEYLFSPSLAMSQCQLGASRPRSLRLHLILGFGKGSHGEGMLMPGDEVRS